MRESGRLAHHKYIRRICGPSLSGRVDGATAGIRIRLFRPHYFKWRMETDRKKGSAGPKNGLKKC